MSDLWSSLFNGTVLLAAIVITVLMLNHPRRGMIATVFLMTGIVIYLVKIVIAVATDQCELASGFPAGIRSMEACVQSYGLLAWTAQVAIITALFSWLSMRMTRYRKDTPCDRSER